MYACGQNSLAFLVMMAFNCQDGLIHCKRSINRVRQDKVCFQEAVAGEQFHGSNAS